jgi:hypothetical protein
MPELAAFREAPILDIKTEHVEFVIMCLFCYCSFFIVGM